MIQNITVQLASNNGKPRASGDDPNGKMTAYQPVM